MTTQSSSLPLSVRQVLREQKPRTGGLQGISHVVILMQENRSFDHYFGDFPGVRGFDDPNAVLLRDGTTEETVFDQPDGRWRRHRFSLADDGSEETPTDHGWDSGHKAWNHGWHDKWIEAKGLHTMSYYKARGVPLYRELAETFTICDAYHCSILSETTSNRNYLFSGYGGYEPDGTRVIDGTAHDREKEKEAYTWASYPELLEQKGIDWKVYQEWDNYFNNNLEFFDPFKKIFRKVLEGTIYPEKSLFQFYKKLEKLDRQGERGEIEERVKALADSAKNNLLSSELSLYERGLFRSRTLPRPKRGFVEAFKKDVDQDKLPQVSYLVPAEVDSEHPPDKPSAGQQVVYQVLDTLASNPKVWNSTVLFLSYDENDGLFDHVPPPIPPRRSEFNDEFVRTDPKEKGDKSSNWLDGQPLGLGIRVPFIVVSPWTVGGYVCSQVFDHTSQVRFLEKWLGVHQELISGWRRTVAGDLTSVFDFQNTGQRPPVVAGTRRARPLPYQPDAYLTPIKDGAFQLILSNKGEASVHLTLYPYGREKGEKGEYKIPQHFDVGRTPVTEPITPAASYRFIVTGPNGFRREFHGPSTGPAAKVTLTSSIADSPRQQLNLTVENHDQTDLTLIYGPASTTTTTRTLLAAGKPTNILFDATASYGWYDLTFTLAEYPSFHRRLIGHIENGKESFAYKSFAYIGKQPTPLMGHFRDGANAAMAWSDNDSWFFKDNQAIKTDGDGNKILKGPANITADGFWPVLKDYPAFASGVDVAMAWGNGQFWFFKGNQAIKTDMAGEKILKGPANITADGFWPALKDYPAFASRVDAGLILSNEAFWFFKGNQAIKTDGDGNKILKGPANITADGFWPVLKDYPAFASGVDVAMAWGNGQFWFFKGNQAIKTDGDGNKILKGPANITAEGFWPALRATMLD